MNNVLLVVDMQNDFIDGSLGTKEAVNIVSNVVKKIKEFEGKIIYTRDTHGENYLSTQEGRYLPVTHCIEGTSGWEIHNDIQALISPENTIYNKVTFGSKDLVMELVEMDNKEPIDEIELIGLCTDICVISNAFTIKAFLPEVKIFVDAKCCAGVTKESHENALNAMKVCQIQVKE
ncbi:isochorismatase family cysteine hydrolase [Tissierella sp. MB52-C2]|uniref:cysteine hydrolase family protein n=1 Tax=Tissierella sp. MB52-C2 TaxID=3070999 RepID=UPI00280BDBA7|nr:isochorismatase family cysteine hydrolase [Tissierella sp. MB52-C2]WMM25380.1 isochorismatase family cysteine hydrolase [Tissierella sp. MB52-C2]